MTSPIFNSYGRFRDSDIFKKLFRIEDEDHFLANQKKAAKEIVGQILCHCNGSQTFPPISKIVDFGCGGGSLLYAIKEELEPIREKKNEENIEGLTYWNVDYLGVDQCEEMIAHANKKYGDSGIVFNSVKAGSNLLEDDALKGIEDWSSTAFLCLGHTWFHLLKQNDLLSFIGEKRPALLLVDVFHTWDDVIAELETKYNNYSASSSKGESIIPVGEQDPLTLLPIFVDEEIRVVSEFVNGEGNLQKNPNSELTLYSLRTQYIETESESHKEVVRGIYIQPGIGGKGQWLFATHQIAKSTESLRPTKLTLNECKGTNIEKLREISGKGEITGVNNYLVLREFEHVSGWGNMHCIAFAALSPEGKALNDAYFKAVSGLVDYLFVDSSKKTPEIENLKEMINIFGKREIAVIMPFDPLRTFSRMVSFTKYQKDLEEAISHGSKEKLPPISTVDLIVEQPNKWQQRFPTAYTLYHSLLDLVSSPIGFPLHKVPEYAMALVDETFDIIETEFLKASVNDNRNGSYFIIPFYFGSLPLFVLILEEPKNYPIGATNAQLFYSLAQNLDRQLHVAIREKLIRNSVIAPFMVGALQGLQQLEAQRGKIAAEIELIRESIPANICNRFKNVMIKPWKSWITALPSHPLTSLDSTSLQNKSLRDVVKFESERIMGDAITQISSWFQIKGYFAGVDGDHDYFNCNSHPNKLTDLMPPDYFTAEGSLLSSDYFKAAETASRRDRNVLIFVDQLVTDMLMSCEHTAEIKPDIYCCNRYRNDKNIAFQIVKRVFCREAENQGLLFRFSFSRLYAVAMASSGELLARDTDGKLLDQIDCTHWASFKETWDCLFKWELENEDIKLGKHTVTCAEGVDTITQISSCIEFLSGACGFVEVKLDHSVHENPLIGRMVITAKTKVPLEENRKGSDYKHFISIIEKHGNPEVKNKTVWKITVNVIMLTDAGIDVDWDVTCDE